MKVLKVSKDCFMWFGICPIDDKMNQRKQLLYKIFGWLAVLICGLIIVSSAVSSFKYGTADLSNALFAAVPGVSAFKLIVSLISVIVHRQKVSLFFENLQSFYNQSKFKSIKTSNGLF